MEMKKLKMELEIQIAIEILEEFQELLNEKNIAIPSKYRTPKPGEARLHGSCNRY